MKLVELQRFSMRERQVMLELLVLVFGKPLEQFVSIPIAWNNCTHTDFECADPWPPEDILTPIVNNIVGSLVHKNKRPVDVAIVRRAGVWSLVVRHEEREALAA